MTLVVGWQNRHLAAKTHIPKVYTDGEIDWKVEPANQSLHENVKNGDDDDKVKWQNITCVMRPAVYFAKFLKFPYQSQDWTFV